MLRNRAKYKCWFNQTSLFSVYISTSSCDITSMATISHTAVCGELCCDFGYGSMQSHSAGQLLCSDELLSLPWLFSCLYRAWYCLESAPGSVWYSNKTCQTVISCTDCQPSAAPATGAECCWWKVKHVKALLQEYGLDQAGCLMGQQVNW